MKAWNILEKGLLRQNETEHCGIEIASWDKGGGSVYDITEKQSEKGRKR